MPATTKQKNKPLTWMQEVFVQAYCGIGPSQGNATEACRIAGYKGGKGTLHKMGNHNINHPMISQAITQAKADIKAQTKDERDIGLQALHEIRDNSETSDRDRIAAIGMEGRMCGWHSTTTILETKDRQIQLDEAQRAIASRAAIVLHDTRRLPDGSYGPDPPITCNVVGE